MVSFDYTEEISRLLLRRGDDGGFQEISGGDYRPDATAWVILCLEAFQVHSDIVSIARSKLRSTQKADGSIPLTADHPEAFWPTSPGSLALYGDHESEKAHTKAISFLLSAIGRHSPNLNKAEIEHDTMIKGWPWIDQTHAWVEPTAIAISALTEEGLSHHSRTRDGIKLLLDRQLTNGGWNYGNTAVYGQQLNPMPAPTGMALWALADHVELSQITESLKYLQEQLGKLKTPLSLGWALKGLSAWSIRFEKGHERAVACLNRQQKYGSYNTSHIAILLLAMAMLDAKGGANV